jgi:hypothetical protein
MALATDTSWRWGITTGGKRGDSSAYARFWDRALRWLARDPALEPCQVTTSRERYGPAAAVQVEGLIRDERYEPMADRPMQVRFERDGSADPGRDGRSVRSDGRGRVQVQLDGPTVPGGYRAVVETSDGSGVRCEVGFVVEAGGEELADPRARPRFLERLAEETGGSFHDAADAPPLRDLDATRTRSLGTVEVAPLATPWALFAVGAILLAEWFVRRRWGRR